VLAQYLEANLDAVHVGELRYLWTRGLKDAQLCECRRPFTDCPFWTEVLALAYPDGVEVARTRMAELRGRVDRMRHIPLNVAVARGWRSAPPLQEYGDILRPLYDAIIQVSGASLVLDSTKEPSYLFALRTIEGLDVRVVHLIRDSRAVAYSWTRSKIRPEIHWEEARMMVRTPASSARRWLEDNTAVEIARLTGPRSVRLRYEDFTHDPEGCVADLRSRLDLPARGDDEPLRHSFSGNPIRFDRTPLRITADQAWTSAMPVWDRRQVSALTAPLLLRYGYPPR
jgi:hypothetical protein